MGNSAMVEVGVAYRLFPPHSTHIMTFEALHDTIECNCIDNAVEDSESAFLRIIDSSSPKERDFLSKWERYIKQGKEISHSTCDETCGWKGVSMNKVNGYEEDEVVNVLRQALLFQPQGKKKNILKFRLSSNAGMIKHSPNEEHASHHDLYKCDSFEIGRIVDYSLV